MSERTEHKLVAGLMLAVLALLWLISLFSTGYPFGAENPGHYLLARYLWFHPGNLLNLWGRPLFTLLASPFALAGMKGIMAMNSLLSVLTGYGGYLIMKRSGFSPAWVAVLFICFTPIWFYVTISALTEVLFGFLLVWSILLIVQGRYILSAIVLSFLMFARLEGFILLPLFGLVFLIRRKYLAIPFLLTGFVLCSLAGALITGDLLWIIDRFPYQASSETYAGVHGSFWHYLRQWDITLGIPLTLLFLTGLTTLGCRIFSRSCETRQQSGWFLLLVATPFLVYVVFHTLLFWLGLGSSLGSVRLISSVFPLAALVAVAGLAAIVKWLLLPGFRLLIILIALAGVVTTGVTTYRYPIARGPEETLIARSTSWIRGSFPLQTPVYLTSQDACYELGINPWDSASGAFIHRGSDPGRIPPGALVLWDSHFGPNELRLPKDSLMFRKDLRLVALFLPNPPWHTLGGGLLEVLVFEKRDIPPDMDNYTLQDLLLREEEERCLVLYAENRQFESPAGWEFDPYLSEEVSFSGRSSYRVDSTVTYGPGVTLQVASLPVEPGDCFIRATAWIWSGKPFRENPASLVISLEREQKPYRYSDLRFERPGYMEPGRWYRVTSRLEVPAETASGDVLKVYIWHRGKGILYCDDLQVELLKRE